MPTLVRSPAPVFPAWSDIPESARVSYRPRSRYLLDGRVKEWTGPSQEVFSPIAVEGKPVALGRHPLMGKTESLAALDAAKRAYDRGTGDWPTMTVAQRISHMESFLPGMEAVRKEVVRLLMWEVGKTKSDSETEFERTLRYLRDTIEALKEIDRTSSRFAIEEGFLAMIRRSPLGVTLCMGPYNYPLNETFATLFPALLMGNTVVVKPPRYGVLVYDPLLEAFADSFPPGVVNVVYGDGSAVVGPLMESGDIDVLAFIGSARVGSLLKHQHPRPNRLRSVLGLGAKNAAVVLPDAELESAVSECVLGALSFNGQRCTAIKIIFVHRSQARGFLDRLNAAVEALIVGMPWDEGVWVTPLPDEGKPDFLQGLVAEAVDKGAAVTNHGGATIDGALFYPAVVYPATAEMRVAQVEQFGPVTPVVPYQDEREVVEWLKACPVGQQAALFGSDPERLSRLIDPMMNQVCRVNINSQCQRGPDKFPFGGRKDSAEGTLSVTDALRVFSIRSMVAAKSTERNQYIVTSIVTGRHSNFLSTDFIF